MIRHQNAYSLPFQDDAISQEEDGAETTEEEISPEAEEEPRDDSEIDWEVYLQDSDSGIGASVDRGQEMPSIEATLRSETSLTEYLLWQLSLAVRDELDKQIGAYLLGNIDDDGYLQCAIDEAAAIFGVNSERVEDVLCTVQSFDPAGIGARDLRECLLIQLRHVDMEESLAGIIVRDYLSQIDERYFRKIARELVVPLEDIIAAVKLIRALDPKPGSRYTAHRVEYIVLDVVVVKMGDEYQVLLNDDGMPKLRINSLYQNILRRGDGMQGDTKEYLEDKFRSAVWLMKSIEQRRQTLLKVAKSICRFQCEFLDKGMPYLRPLVLKDVASDIEMHESTVSRVTTNKYIHTPPKAYLNSSFSSIVASIRMVAMRCPPSP